MAPRKGLSDELHYVVFFAVYLYNISYLPEISLRLLWALQKSFLWGYWFRKVFLLRFNSSHLVTVFKTLSCHSSFLRGFQKWWVSGLFPLLSLLTYISFPVTTGRTVSELTRSYMGTESAQTLLGTPQVTRGESRSITSPYCQLVTSRSLALQRVSQSVQ